MTLESASTLIAAESQAVKRTMDTLASDPDPGIRELRTMLAQEAAAVDALDAAMEKRKRAAEEVKNANGAVAGSQLKAPGQAVIVEADAGQAVEQSGQETAAWAQYYDLLAKVERTASPRARCSSIPRLAAPTPRSPSPAADPVHRCVVVSVLRRFVSRRAAGVGRPGGQEENGHATGTLVARFKLPPGSKGDPMLKFDFTGDFREQSQPGFQSHHHRRRHRHPRTDPGPAFNLLEVNFETQPKPGKVRLGNMVLLKK